MIKSQIKGAYIDDLKVEIDALHDYFQLKNVQNVKNSWAEIKEDIVSQVKLSLDNKEQFSISIVYSDAEVNLREEFPESIYQLFEFIYFAIEEDKDDKGWVVPGIGGSVYEKLGVESRTYYPEILDHRML